MESAVKNNDGKLCFINNSAENILNYEYFDEHGQSQTLWNSIDAVLPEGYVELIFKGENYNVEGKRLTECYPGTMCLNDFVSKQYFLHNGSGDVSFIFTDSARADSTAALTEIETLLSKDSVEREIFLFPSEEVIKMRKVISFSNAKKAISN